MNLEMLLTTLMAVVIPFIVSTYLWPFAQAKSALVTGLPNGVKQLVITLLNGLLAFGATFIGVVMPALDQFAMSDLQAVLTALVGFLTTLVFKTGKTAGQLSA